MWTKLFGAALVVALGVAACSDEQTAPDPPVATTAALDPAPGPASAEFDNQALPSHLAGVAAVWETDFSQATVDLDEILVGIPINDPRDAIPPIDSPRFEPVPQITWLDDREPGVLIVVGNDARFYPLSIMTRHEIVNDVIDGAPIAVTYCPLCNTAVAFDRRLDGHVLRLGVSGLLRNSDLVMWDDLSESLWQQVTGEAIVGSKAGSSLEPIPSAIVSWADFAANHPGGNAMSGDQGFGIPYGRNPYEFYSSRSTPLSFFQGEIDPRYPALERVVGVTVNDVSKAYPFPELQQARVVNDVVGGESIVVLWGAPDTADALDAGTIAAGRAVGIGIAFSSVVDGRMLTFEPAEDGLFRDAETGTSWNILGFAVAGALLGEELDIVTHRNELWFAWQAFFAGSEVWGPSAATGHLVESPAPEAGTEIGTGVMSTRPLRR